MRGYCFIFYYTEFTGNEIHRTFRWVPKNSKFIGTGNIQYLFRVKSLK